MTGIEYLNSEDCPNIKNGMGLNQIHIYVIAGILETYHKKQLIIDGVSNWVAIESTEQPEIMSDVMVKFKDGRKEVAFFDGDKRFYIEKDDRDITDSIIEWHRLP